MAPADIRTIRVTFSQAPWVTAAAEAVWSLTADAVLVRDTILSGCWIRIENGPWQPLKPA